MAESNLDKEHLLRRRAEITEELERVNNDLRMELDPDAEEQAIQIEQDEVTISMEENLQRELAEIDDRLGELDKK